MKYLFLMSLVTFNSWGLSLNEEVSQVTNLRQEVELLSSEIEVLKKSQQAEMDVYIQRFQEVESLLLKEKFRQSQLQTQIQLGKAKLTNHLKEIKGPKSDLWIKNFWNKYLKSLSVAHPLMAEKLKDRIEKLKIELNFKKISYEHALLQTWFVLETDLNKSQDAEFVLAPLQLDGKLYHVEMVRFGRTQGYFRTSEGQYGQLTFDKKWQLQFFEDATSKTQIETLLGQFKQQNKTGFYHLPGLKI